MLPTTAISLLTQFSCKPFPGCLKFSTTIASLQNAPWQKGVGKQSPLVGQGHALAVQHGSALLYSPTFCFLLSRCCFVVFFFFLFLLLLLYVQFPTAACIVLGCIQVHSHDHAASLHQHPWFCPAMHSALHRACGCKTSLTISLPPLLDAMCAMRFVDACIAL